MKTPSADVVLKKLLTGIQGFDEITEGGLRVALLQKPFTPGALAHKFREVLDQPSGGEG